AHVPGGHVAGGAEEPEAVPVILGLLAFVGPVAVDLLEALATGEGRGGKRIVLVGDAVDAPTGKHQHAAGNNKQRQGLHSLAFPQGVRFVDVRPCAGITRGRQCTPSGAPLSKGSGGRNRSVMCFSILASRHWSDAG